MFCRKPVIATWLLLILIMAPAAAPVLAADAWESIGPYGADILALAEDVSGQQIYAASRYGGVYVSADGANNWSQVSSGLALDLGTGGHASINGVTVNQATGRVFALGGLDIYVSDTGGQAWSPMERPPGSKFTRLFLDPDDNERLILINLNSIQVYDYVGMDTERSWSAPPGITTAPVMDLEFSGSSPDIGYAVAGFQAVLFRSDDRSGSFTEVGTLPGSKFRDLTVDSGNPSRLYLSVDTGCFLTDDGGVNWVRMDDPSDNAQIFQFEQMGPSLLAVGRGELFSNTLISNQLAPVRTFYHTVASDLLVLSDGGVLIASAMGVFAGTSELASGGGTLEHRARGMTTTDINTVVPVQGSPVMYAAAGLGYDGGVFRSPDGGMTWELRSLGITNPDVRSLAVYPGDPNIVYAGSSDGSSTIGESGKIFKSVNGGMTWTDVTGGLPHSEARIIKGLLVHPTNPDVVYASVQAIYGGIFKTTDGGATWTNHSDGLESMPQTVGHEQFHDYYAMLSMAFDPVNSDRIHLGAGGCWGGTYLSTNAGETWQRRSAGAMEYDTKVFDTFDPDFWFAVHLELSDIDVDPMDRNHLYATGERGDFLSPGLTVGIMFESKDGGASWTLVPENHRSDYFTVSTTALAMHEARPGHLYVSGLDGVRVSYDAGTNWESLNQGLSTATKFGRSIEFDPDDPNIVYLATAFGGIQRLSLPPVAVALTHLEGAATDKGTVRLTWGVADRENHLGFHVDREINQTRVRLTETPIRDGGDTFVFEDLDTLPGVLHRYWLIELDRTGRETEYGPVDVLVSPPTLTTFLSPPHPNPMTRGTRLNLIAARSTPGRIAVFDLRGREVAVLGNGWLSEGLNEIAWDGNNFRGMPVSGGVYFIKAIVGGETAVQRLVVNR